MIEFFLLLCNKHMFDSTDITKTFLPIDLDIYLYNTARNLQLTTSIDQNTKFGWIALHPILTTDASNKFRFSISSKNKYLIYHVPTNYAISYLYVTQEMVDQVQKCGIAQGTWINDQGVEEPFKLAYFRLSNTQKTRFPIFSSTKVGQIIMFAYEIKDVVPIDGQETLQLLMCTGKTIGDSKTITFDCDTVCGNPISVNVQYEMAATRNGTLLVRDPSNKNWKRLKLITAPPQKAVVFDTDDSLTSNDFNFITPIPADPNQPNDASSCTSTQIFVNGQCQECPANTKPNATKYFCDAICSGNTIEGPQHNCIPCPDNSQAIRNNTACQPICDKKYIRDPKDELRCIQCPSGQYPDITRTKCISLVRIIIFITILLFLAAWIFKIPSSAIIILIVGLIIVAVYYVINLMKSSQVGGAFSSIISKAFSFMDSTLGKITGWIGL